MESRGSSEKVSCRRWPYVLKGRGDSIGSHGEGGAGKDSEVIRGLAGTRQGDLGFSQLPV